MVHNGVPWPVDPAPDPGRRIVGINGLLTPWKGHQVLLDAVELLPDDVTVEMMGGVLPKDTDHAAALRRRAEGVSEKMLAQTLRILEADGLVHRDARPVVPPHVEYSLTERGAELAERMVPLMDWIAVHAAAIVADAEAAAVTR